MCDSFFIVHDDADDVYLELSRIFLLCHVELRRTRELCQLFLMHLLLGQIPLKRQERGFPRSPDCFYFYESYATTLLRYDVDLTPGFAVVPGNYFESFSLKKLCGNTLTRGACFFAGGWGSHVDSMPFSRETSSMHLGHTQLVIKDVIRPLKYRKMPQNKPIL